MARPRRCGQRNTTLVVVYDDKEGHLVYRFNLKKLFSDRHGDDERRPDEVLPLPPTPVARFPHPPVGIQHMAFAAAYSSGGPNKNKIIVAATDKHGTIVYATSRKESSPGPGLRANKCRPIILAVPTSGHDMLVTTSYRYPPSGPQFEALSFRGGRCRPAAAPVPPPPFDTDSLSACFVEGTRIWMGVDGQGTYSLDMARRAWRKEGTWSLPLEDGAIYVPALGLLLGFMVGCLSLCAYDIKSNPPAIRQQWKFGDLLPTEHDGYRHREGFLFSFASLDYLGGGRFCIAWSSSPAPAAGGCSLFALTAAELTRHGGSAEEGELQLRKRKSRCCFLSRDQIMGYILR